MKFLVINLSVLLSIVPMGQSIRLCSLIANTYKGGFGSELNLLSLRLKYNSFFVALEDISLNLT